MTNTYLIGQSAEQIAADYLTEKGLLVVGRNYRNRFGEIDIIAKDGKDFVIVEVKSKRTSSFGKPYEMITKKKKRKLVATSKNYLVSEGIDIEKINWRIDVISVDYKKGEIEWIKNAIWENDLKS